MALNYYVIVKFFTSVLFFFIYADTSRSLGLKKFYCNKVSPCRCETIDGMGFDLSPLVNGNGSDNKTDSRFVVASGPGTLFYYHPCFDEPLPTFNQTDCRTGSALCYYKQCDNNTSVPDSNNALLNSSTGVFYKLAKADEADFMMTDGGLLTAIIYKHGNNKTTIEFSCSENESSSTTLEMAKRTTDFFNPVLLLRSPYACKRLLPSMNENHMSSISIFFAIVLSIAATYIIGGLLVLVLIKGLGGCGAISSFSLSEYLKTSCNRQSSDSYEQI